MSPPPPCMGNAFLQLLFTNKSYCLVGNILTDIHVNTEEILQVVRLISKAYKEGVKLPSPVGMLCNANVPMPIKDDSCMEKLEEEIKDREKRKAMVGCLCKW